MVAAHREQTGMLQDAVRANDVFGRASADIDDERAQFLLFGAQHGERRGQPVEDNVFDFQLQTFHRADRVLQAVEIAVDDVHVHFHLRAEHSDRVLNMVLAVHAEVLPNDVHHVILGGQIDGLGVLDHVLHIFLGDFAVGGNDRMHAAVVETAEVSATDAEIDAAHLHVSHLFGLDDGVAYVLARQPGIDNLRLAHAAGRGLADAEDAERAGVVDLADHGADFRRARFQTDDEGRAVKHVSSC